MAMDNMCVGVIGPMVAVVDGASATRYGDAGVQVRGVGLRQFKIRISKPKTSEFDVI